MTPTRREKESTDDVLRQFATLSVVITRAHISEHIDTHTCVNYLTVDEICGVKRVLLLLGNSTEMALLLCACISLLQKLGQNGPLLYDTHTVANCLGSA